MEKLRKLLQYYEDDRIKRPSEKKKDFSNNKALKDNTLLIISKQYGFIERAYRHKHIDYCKYTDARHCMYKVSGCYPHRAAIDIVKNIIMVLSCEDEPLEFLIESLQ